MIRSASLGCATGEGGVTPPTGEIVWRVEWRKALDRPRRPFLILARELCGGAEARAFALAFGSRALGGEFRLTPPAAAPAILDLRRLRQWDPAGAMPDAPGTLWGADLRLAAARQELAHAVRLAVAKGTGTGAISRADGAALVNFAALLAPR